VIAYFLFRFSPALIYLLLYFCHICVNINFDKTLDLVLDQTNRAYTKASITISVRPHTRIVDTVHHSSPIKERLKPTSLFLTTTIGSMTHKFEVDGEAQICIHVAAPKGHDSHADHTYRFGLRIHKAENDPLYHKMANQPVHHMAGDDDSTTAKNDALSPLGGHLSHLELEMKRIDSGMQSILSEADFVKTKEGAFHIQTMNMHRATTYWPIVQCLVLLMTGFTQASHIVRFFKSRRII
jgi:hypothetical protein